MAPNCARETSCESPSQMGSDKIYISNCAHKAANRSSHNYKPWSHVRVGLLFPKRGAGEDLIVPRQQHMVW